MKRKLQLLFLLITTSNIIAQINFENEKVLIDRYQMPSSNAEIISSDLNGDNFKDLIVTTSDGSQYITIYPNIQGDHTTTQPKLIWNNSTQNENPTGMSTIDVDNDGLIDIIFCNKYDDKINWFRNLGNFNFSPITLLKSVINGPELSLITDIDNDGLKDIVINLDTNDSMIWLKNNGDGTFLEPQAILSNIDDIMKILATDLNNDGLPEIIIGDNSNKVYWAKNLGSGAFDAKTQLANANSGISFEFVDLNNDNYLDYVSTISNYLIKRINQSGNTFQTGQFTTIGVNFGNMQLKDMDEDGITDLVGSTGTSISYLKRFANGTFNSPTTLININDVSNFIAEDINNDASIDFIIPLYATSNTEKRLSTYTKNALTNSFDEKIISLSNGAVFCVKIADLDNDGKNDIISSFGSVVWNKNKGNGDFTSYKKISTTFGSILTYDIEVVDIDNDNDKDIVASTQVGLEIYYNDGNGNFTLGYNLALTYASKNIDVADLNGDGFKDIVMTFRTGVSSGTVCLAWIPNLTGITFGNLTTLGTSVYGYEPYLLVCSDMDNDGDIDILTYSNEHLRLHLHTNNGSGIFTYSPLGDTFSAVCIAVEDYNNDGFKDIFAAGNYYHPGIYIIKNNNGVYATRSAIEYKKADAIGFADINGDGLKEIIGTATETSNLGTLYYYLNNGTSFGSQILISSETSYTSERNIALGDLNNDNKHDIAKSYYFRPQVSYFINSSVLSIAEYEIKDNISIYPIPFTESISWKLPNNNLYSFDITIFDLEGKLVFSKKEINTSYIDLTFLPKGIYIFNLKSGATSYSRKIVKD